MKWPWVSRLAYDLVVEQNKQLLDHVTRIQRREAGMPENPRQLVDAAQKPVDIPDEIEELLGGFDSEQVRVGIRDQVKLRAANGSAWDVIAAELRRQLGPEAEEDA